MTKEKKVKRWIVWLLIYIFIIMFVLTIILCVFFFTDEKLCLAFVTITLGIFKITSALAILSMVDSSKKKDK